MYNFDVPWAVLGGALGASHFAEISHVFGLPLMPDEASRTVSDAMNYDWARFAKNGDPNGSNAPAQWPRVTPDEDDRDRRPQFDADFRIVEDLRREECAFWRRSYEAAE